MSEQQAPYKVISFNELTARRIALAMQTEIPDMKAYAEEWNKLGADFEAAYCDHNAALCFANWKHYSGLHSDGEQTAFTRVFGEPCGVVAIRNIGNYQNVYRDGDSRHIPAVPLVIVQNYYTGAK